MQKLSKEERRAIRDADKSSSYLDAKNSIPPTNLQVINPCVTAIRNFLVVLLMVVNI